MQQEIIDKILTDFSQHDEKKQAVDRLFQYLYFHLAEFGIYHADEDTRSDFLLWLYPKLHDIISKYNPQLSIFFTYIRMSVKFHWQLFERKNHQQASYTAIAYSEQQQTVEYMMEEQANTSCSDLYAASQPPEYTICPEKEKAIKQSIQWKTKKHEIYQRQLLLLACKSCFFINDPVINQLATALNIPIDTVRTIIEKTRQQAAAKDVVYARLAAKRDFYYIRYKSATLQLEIVDKTHTALCERLLIQQTYNYNRWQCYLKRTKAYHRSPSNRSLAKQFGISRGTVDNNLAVLKKACYGKP